MDFNNQDNQNSQNNQYYDGTQTYQTYQTQTYQAPVLEQQPNRHLAGLIGALIGALLGSIVWILIGMLGYVAALAAALIIILAKFGYNKLNKKMDTFGIVSCIVIGLLIIFPASTATYAFQLCQALNEYVGPYSYWEVITDFPFHMGIVDGLWGEFWKFILQSYFYAAIGVAIACADMFGKKN